MQSIAVGTLIATPAGPLAVELLEVGAVLLGAGGTQHRLQWVTASDADAGEAIQIPAGSLAPGLPGEALTVGAQTRIGFDSAYAAIPAADLLDGGAITRSASSVKMTTLTSDLPTGVLAAGLVLGAPGETTSLALVEALAELARRRGDAPGPLRGHLDRAAPGVVGGWAMDTTQPGRPVPLVLIANRIRLDAVLARAYRADLEHAGQGDGRVAFRFTLDPPLPADRPHLIQVRRGTDQMPLPGSPILIETETQVAAPVARYTAMTDAERVRIVALLQAQIDTLL